MKHWNCTGNVLRDPGRENADVDQLKALLAAEIIKALDRDRLTFDLMNAPFRRWESLRSRHGHIALVRSRSAAHSVVR